MLLGIILLPLLARFSLFCRMWAFPITLVFGLWGERTGLSFWAGAKSLGVLLGLPFLWFWRVCLRSYFSNPISFLNILGEILNIEEEDNDDLDMLYAATRRSEGFSQGRIRRHRGSVPGHRMVNRDRVERLRKTLS